MAEDQVEDLIIKKSELQRRDDWLHRLWEVVAVYRHTKFEYGKNDCALFYARCIDAMTDSRFADELLSIYQDKKGAARFIRAEGGMEMAITKRLGTPVSGPCARRGDGVLFTRHNVGACMGAHAFVPTNDGLKSIAMHKAIKHWRVA